MKLSKLFKVSGLALALPISVSVFITPLGKAQANGDFSRSCSGFYLIKSEFFAKCIRRDGSTNQVASIELGDYITNNNGTLAWQRGGGFQGSCKDSRPMFNTLVSTCKARDQSLRSAVINLDENITNDNGVLKYVGRKDLAFLNHHKS